RWRDGDGPLSPRPMALRPPTRARPDPAPRIQVQVQDLFQGQKERLGHGYLASFLNVRSCAAKTFFCALATRFRREASARIDVTIRRSPSVVTSSSVSAVIFRSSRKGLSMMSPELFPMICRRLIMLAFHKK